MRYLLLTTFIWAFSFSFIGEILAGRVDSYFAVLVRIGLASLVFLPFTKFRGIDKALKVKIMLIGSVQIGFMYIFFYQSFLFLSVPEVILFTIFTPIYVTLIYDGLKGQFNPLYLVSTGMAVLGAYIIRYQNVDSEFITGFLMVQGANICFALGQSAYKKVMESNPNIIHSDVFGYFYFGALLVGIVAFALLADHSKLSPTLLQWSVLLWLGIVASGIGYFLWNKGACDVDAGVLGIMNNALVPAGLVMNLLLWKTPVDYVSLSIGSGIILFSLVLHYRLINRKHAL
ncbi:EamA family transporter [Sulfurospirillum sp. MES]|uniref:EamA family transporter n=1 Tax=Sulfurospirillum sp. MES TaxID=1565314 RepID=UPI0005427E4F|nr:EamA family transporter [Sulfurospirillum sp. MES]KHG33129.1 MAG: membrane protein [Sulfurospirillum sp. MES]